MNFVQNVIDRELGIYSTLNYDNILKRLVVNRSESFHRLRSSFRIPYLYPDPAILACRFSQASGYEHILALAIEDGRVAIQDTTSMRTAVNLPKFQCHNNAVLDLAWMPHNMNFVTASGKDTALWDVAVGSPKRVLVFSKHTRSVKTVAFRPTEPSVFASGARDGHILVWDIRANRQPSMMLKPDNWIKNCHSIHQHKTPQSRSKWSRIDKRRPTSISGLVFQNDLTLISCGDCDGNIKVWDLRKNYNVYKRDPLPKFSIPYCGSSTPTGYSNLIIDDLRMRLYASCMDNVIYCFNISSYNMLPEQGYIGHKNSTFYIKTSLSPDSRYLLSGSSDKNAYIWNVKYSEPVVKLTGHWAEVDCATWCQKDDMKIVTCSDDGNHKIWRIALDFRDPDIELFTLAKLVPRTNNASLPQWGALDGAPNSLKRKKNTIPGSYNPNRVETPGTSTIKTNRCLADLMNRYIPKAGSSYMTPTKNYEVTNCKNISPKSLKEISLNTLLYPKSPIKVSPTKVKSFATPTENLPNFVLTGESPHLMQILPVKKKEQTNWLTLMAKEKKIASENADKANIIAPLRYKKNVPAGRNSTSVKNSKSTKQSNTIVKYFSVTDKDE